MTSQVATLCYYGIISRFRKSVGPGSSVRDRIKFALALATPVAVFLGMVGVYRLMSEHFVAQHLGQTDAAVGALQAGTLAVTILTFSLTFMEVLRDFGFAPDAELFALAPLPIHRWILYRLLSVAIRSLPWSATLLAFPIIFTLSSTHHPRSVKLLISLILFFVLYWVWIVAAALFGALGALVFAARSRISRSSAYALLWLLFIGVTTTTTYCFIDPDQWMPLAQKYERGSSWIWILPSHQIGTAIRLDAAGHPLSAHLHRFAAIATMVITGIAFWRWSLRLGRCAITPILSQESPAPVVRLRIGKPHFASRLSWMMLQKDIKDLLRNPSYRHSLVATCILLPLALWAQARSVPPASGGPPSRLMFSVLSLIYLVPFFFSMRAFALEHRLLDLYRITLPRASRVLTLKLTIQTVVNGALAGILAIPFFSLLVPKARLLEVSYFAVAVIVYLPIFTMLAIALGTLFPQVGDPPGAFGASKKGILIYFAVNVFIFAFQLETYRQLVSGGNFGVMLAGTFAATIALVICVLMLFARARMKVDCGIEQRRHAHDPA